MHPTPFETCFAIDRPPLPTWLRWLCFLGLMMAGGLSCYWPAFVDFLDEPREGAR
jgi:hypothetical protein